MEEERIKVSRGFLGGSVVKNLSHSAGGTGSIPGPGTGIPHAAWSGQKQRERRQTPCCKPALSSQASYGDRNVLYSAQPNVAAASHMWPV